MMETLRDWQRQWIEINGITRDLEVVIYDSTLDKYHPSIYEGCFADINPDLLDREVIETARVIASSDPKRNGAYSLTI